MKKEIKEFIPTKRHIYDELSRVLTDYEDPETEDQRTTEKELYKMLVKIQNHWEDVITAE